MNTLSKMGIFFYGIAIAGLGLLIIYFHDFPYMLIPPRHNWIQSMYMIGYLGGTLMIVAGISMIVGKKARSAALLLGTILLLIFCCWFIPYQFIFSHNYMHLVDWENAEKELALAGGAFIIAACFPKYKQNSWKDFLQKLIPLGPVLFSIPMISFGILHILYAKEVADYAPSWVPYRLVWIYIAGGGLISSGLAIMLNIQSRLAATLLGAMIFIWVIILHIPRVIVAPATEMSSELTSALIALAYSGIAFVIAGRAKNKPPNSIFNIL